VAQPSTNVRATDLINTLGVAHIPPTAAFRALLTTPVPRAEAMAEALGYDV
jgi:hypothetical protein